jgi:chemotaxis protein MotB
MDEDEVGEGLPAWIMTFADLMTLLMCFFVLMLSFSEMDVAKLKQLSDSVKEAFGVQTDVKVKNIPKGTSIIAKEFSPSKPQPTPVTTIRQFTINSNKNSLDVGAKGRDNRKKQQAALEAKAAKAREADKTAERLRKALSKEISEGKVLIRREESAVIVHILERHSFGSGKAELEPRFKPALRKISQVLATVPGAITIAGHTDDVPIRTAQFRSNWDLSAARAASVAHELLAGKEIISTRLMVSGHADTQPRVANDSSANRAKNRRIDITVLSGVTAHRAWPASEDTDIGTDEDAMAEDTG